MKPKELEKVLDEVPILLANNELMAIGICKKLGTSVAEAMGTIGYGVRSAMFEHEAGGYTYMVVNRDCYDLPQSIMYEALMHQYGHLYPNHKSVVKDNHEAYAAAGRYLKDKRYREPIRQKIIQLCGVYDV